MKKEKELFPPLKKYFNDKGFKVFVEVPSMGRSIDFVAVNDNEHIAVEMKMSLTKKVLQQARLNALLFDKSIIAIPTKPKNNKTKFLFLEDRGIGLLLIKNNNIITLFEAKFHSIPARLRYDFSTFIENDNDEAGNPCQKGISSAFVVLARVKEYVKNNPKTTWREIYKNVQHHYSSLESLTTSMNSWKGFNLCKFKKSLSICFKA